MALTVSDVPDQNRFEARWDDGELAGFLEYQKNGGSWSLTHAFTFPHQRGNGVAAQVTKFALDAAQEAGATVRPICPFVADYIEANPQYTALTR